MTSGSGEALVQEMVTHAGGCGEGGCDDDDEDCGDGVVKVILW